MTQFKYSRQRESIKENLKNRKDHPTANMVYADVRKIYPNISLGTVYRNLSLLAEQGVLRKIVDEDGVIHFDYDTSPHNHFICRKCGCVIDIADSGKAVEMEKLRALADEVFEGSVEECSILFTGLCKKCMDS